MSVQALQLIMDYDRSLQQRMDMLNRRLVELDRQIHVADAMLHNMDTTQSYQDDIFDDGEGFEREYCIDSSDDEDSDDETVVYRSHVNPYFDEDSDDEDDSETVVGEWEDPFHTPDRYAQEWRRYVDIPDDLEDGLDAMI